MGLSRWQDGRMVREKVKLDYTVDLPLFLAERFDSLNLVSAERTKALKFLRILVKNAKRENDSGNMFSEVELPYNYLKKVLGGSYNKTIKLLIEAKVINRNDSYSTFSNKCKIYKLENDQEIEFRDKVEELAGVAVRNPGCTTISTFLHNQCFKTYIFKEKASPETRELTKHFKESLTCINLSTNRLETKMIARLNELSIDYFRVNEQIRGKAVCLGKMSNDSDWRKKSDAILEAKNKGKILIQDNKKFVIMTEEEFLYKKKTDILLSHTSIIRKLERGEIYSSRNSTNNRLDTNFTSMPSYMLKEIMDQNGLVEIDLCNSQMAILTLVSDLKTEDYELFKEQALSCNIYEYIQQELDLKTRSEAKEVCFSVLFSSHKNRGINNEGFKKLFPTLMSWIEDYKKEKGSNQFSIMLQKKESEIFIDNLYQRIINEGLLVFSKHDSFIVRKEDESQVRDIMEQYFNEIDFNVTIR